MIDLYEGILTTRAIRRYTDEPVTVEEIRKCLRAAQQAPSGGNSQPWQYLVITDPDVKRKVAEIYRRSYRRWETAQLASLPEFRTDADREAFMRSLRSSRYLAEHLDEAAALVAFLVPDVDLAPSDADGRVDIGPIYASVYPAVQNFCLAARALGIGTVLTTVYWSEMDQLRRVLDVPERYVIAALVPMGRPRGAFGVAPRRPAETVTHWNRFGNREP
ncbi:MAG: oxidoreductase [Acidimicrobiia bacterium]|nr:MAG: oxidoreductase [Acidimicrobiia bacterium]